MTFANHIRDDCLCQHGIENADLFLCGNYTNQRLILFQTTRNLHPLNLEKLLFGDPNFSEEEHTSLFVRQYIKSTHRLNTNIVM